MARRALGATEAAVTDGEGGQPARRPKTKPRKRARRERSIRQASNGQIPGPRRALGRRIAVAAAVAGALGALAISTWFFVLYPASRGPGDGNAVEVDVPPNASAAALAASLSAVGVVSNPRLFALWVRATGGTATIASGKHLLTDDASPGELIARLGRRASAGTVRVTFPEGWNRFEMARRLQDKHIAPLRGFLAATTEAALLREIGVEGDSAEGFLFPASYDLPFDSDPREVVRRMKREFDRRWDVLSRSHGPSLNDVMTSARLGIRDVVTLASMVEKEAAVDDERAVIASVFLNRLRDPAFKPKRLDCDPTAAYGCLLAADQAASCANFTGKATALIEHDPNNPYSTYTHEGLPPGPIANPGARSIEAVMAPAATHYFFFVARGEGRHSFSETYEAHLSALKGGNKAL